MQTSSEGLKPCCQNALLWTLWAARSAGAPGLLMKSVYYKQLLLSWWMAVLLANSLSGDTPNSQHGAFALLLVSNINHSNGAW